MSACPVPHADCVTRPAVLAQITCYTARIVCERLWVTGTRGSFTRAAELYNRMQPAPRPRRSLAAVAWLDDPGIGDPWSAGVHKRHERGLWLRRRVSGSRTALLPSMGRAQHSPAKPRTVVRETGTSAARRISVMAWYDAALRRSSAIPGLSGRSFCHFRGTIGA
jgi:hypothetical protein